MPAVVRTISTRLAIEGEAAYKQAMASINAELKNMGSALKLVEAEYKGNANSMAALTAKGDALSKMQEGQARKVKELESALQNAQKAQQAYTNRADEARAKIAAVEKEMGELANSAGDASGKQKELQESLDKLNKELQEAEAYQAAATKGVNNWERQLNNAKIEQVNLSDAIDKNNKYLNEAKASADGTAASIDKFGKETNKGADGIEALGAALVAAGVTKALNEITEAIRACVDASIEFESAMTGVFKTVEGTDEQLAAITDGVKQMALNIPASTTEIAAVAEAAGQLGIKTEDVLKFTEVMINLGVATNLSAEEAATSLAKFANITGLTADQYEKLGSAIVELGNNSATTESDIVNMATRIASAGTQVNLTEAQIMGISAALSSVGLEAQAGGTAISKFIIDMAAAVETGSEELNDFAGIAGMTNEAFSQLFREDAAAAMTAFFTGLGEGSDSAILKLKDMGVEETRLRDTMLRLSGANELFAKSIDLSTKAMGENTALAEEAGKRYATTESKVQMAKNAFNQLEVAIGDALTPALRNLSDAGNDAFTWAADVIEDNPWLVQSITAVTVGLGALAISIAGVNVGVNILIPAWQTFTAALAAHPIGAAAIAITAVVAALGTLIIASADAKDSTSELLDSVKDARKEYEETKTATAETAKAMDDLVVSIVNLADKEALSVGEKAALSKMVDELNQKIPGLSLTVDENTGKLSLNAEALWDVVEAQKASLKNADDIARMNQLEADKVRFSEELAAVQEDLAAAYADQTQAIGHNNSVITTNDWLIAELAIKESVLEEQLGLTEEELAEVSLSVERYSEVMGYAISDTSKLSAETIQRVDEIVAKMAELETAYTEAFNAAYESINNQIGLWEEMDNSAKTSADTLITATQSQMQWLESYSNNLDHLRSRNIDGIDMLVEYFSDGSKESAAALAGLRDASDSEIRSLINNLSRVDEGKQHLAGQFAEIETNFTEMMDAINQEVDATIGDLERYEETYNNMASTGKGALDGISPYLEEIQAMIQETLDMQSKLSGTRSGKNTWWIDGSHAGGLDYVPWDGYIAELHRGERVQTADEADEARRFEAMIEAAIPSSIFTQRAFAPAATKAAGESGGDTIVFQEGAIQIRAEDIEDIADIVRYAKAARQDSRRR